MSFTNWFLHPIQHQYAVFTGRVTRKSFWIYVLVCLVIFIPLKLAADAVLLGGLVDLLALVVLVPSIAITARRLHDTGKSGWWQLVGLIPLVGVIVMIVFLVQKGDAGDNEYGPVPADPDSANKSTPKQSMQSDRTEPPVTPAE